MDFLKKVLWFITEKLFLAFIYMWELWCKIVGKSDQDDW